MGAILRSLPPKAYQRLPALAAPAGYICVLRDVDSDAYRIDGTRHPEPFIAAMLAEAERAFGIELVSIVQTDDLPGSACELYRRHHATLSAQWHRLDAYQLQELRGSFLRIKEHSSHYLRPRRASRALPQAKAQPTNPAEPPASDASELPARQGSQRMTATRSPVYKKYGAGALRQHRLRSRARQQREASQPLSIKQKLSQGLDSLLLNHPWLVLILLAIILLICLLLLEQGYYSDIRFRY